ncbi:LuxR C-terminal-related transcriptional regulator [Amycolatopsis acidiphila]|uniref:LuxR family transcriptional regulator n=1 Tax=Amycolatopsis acidiphila TaxID=715473 RepID=A0A558AIS7_9PSEU|nr:LuxR C-terminal-related transcriptional regulator [Amycolatopsis acidiphila]TVT24101.1 LuxR family transcriptional regulator [Amycolatopsis acidiphila]UIJ57743.1 LuxR C-terminal-related transcriptional regulator [Amycolatopsis acidiphila]GHG87423.1 LuxR family transcriptional regulator [Amycolatopsis acidiphila]
MVARLVGNLPAEVTNFVGRERELGQVRRLLSAGRLVTLTGPGGVGKTRLARRVACEVHRAFPDGVWLVELAELGEGDLLAVEVAKTLGLTDSSREPTESLAEYLSDKNLLLVLDNCEHLSRPVVKLLSKLLARAPALRVLATSRHVLGSEGERLFEVPALSLPETDTFGPGPAGVISEAVDLFLDRAAAVVPELPEGPEFRRAVIELCRRLDGIPLAIELAAARMRAYPVEEILARVESALDMLTTGPASAPPRHRGLKAAIGWSFDLCSPSEQLMWARLSVFAGGFDLAAAEGICSDDRLPRADVFDLLGSLVDKSILHRQSGGGARFSMLETVREYGRSRLAGLGEDKEVRLRHIRHFAALAERERTDYFSEREIGWFQEISFNHANIRLALQASLFDLHEPRIALRVAARLRMYWATPGVVLEGYQWLRKALAANPEPTEDRAEALWACAYIEVLLAEVDSAARTMAECRELAGRFSLHRVDAALTLCPILADFLLGDVTAALAHAREAVACGRKVDEPTVTGEALFYAASMAFASRDPGAERLADEALEFLERKGAQLWRASALWINGLVRCRADSRDEATTCFLDAFEIFRRLNYGLGVALCLDGLAWVAASAGELARAAALLGAAHPIWETGPHHMMPYLFSQLAVKGEVETLVRAGVGDAAFAEAFSRGTSRSPEELVGEITGLPSPGPTAGSPVTTQDRLGALTKRERRVAELLAKGMSNREIAAELVLSHRTVESHVQHILTKLDFHSRTQIASLVSRVEAAGWPEVRREPATVARFPPTLRRT